MAERLGESRNDASNKNNPNRTQCRPALVLASGREAVVTASQARRPRARVGEAKHQARTAGEGPGCPAGAGAVQAVQTRMGGHRRADSERPGNAVCLPVLPEVASRAGSRAWIQEDAQGAVEPVAPRGGIGKQWH